MIGVVVIGAAGRMGRLIVKNILSSSDLELVGAVEIKQHVLLGEDAGAMVGSVECGVKITDDLNNALDCAEIVIDFSTGDILENVKTSITHGAGVIIGATTLSKEHKQELKSLVSHGARIVCTPNMSVGANVLFDIMEKVARTLGDSYDIEIIELHHNHKKDAPSGTAMEFAKILSRARNVDIDKNICYGRHGMIGERPKDQICIHSIRGGDIVGEHTIVFASNGERLELTHKATNRETFAIGALIAARYLKNAPPGYYDMRDVLLQNRLNLTSSER